MLLLLTSVVVAVLYGDFVLFLCTSSRSECIALIVHECRAVVPGRRSHGPHPANGLGEAWLLPLGGLKGERPEKTAFLSCGRGTERLPRPNSK